MLEVPVGLGVGYVLRKRWQLESELGFRVGFGHHGSMYVLGTGRTGHASNDGLLIVVNNPGVDRFALGITIGVSLHP